MCYLVTVFHFCCNKEVCWKNQTGCGGRLASYFIISYPVYSFCEGKGQEKRSTPQLFPQPENTRTLSESCSLTDLSEGEENNIIAVNMQKCCDNSNRESFSIAA